MLNNVSRRIAKNLRLSTVETKSQNKVELNCHCGHPVLSTPRTDPLAECQLLCASHCEYKLTLKPINFLNTVPALFVFEIIETGEVFKSFRVNPRSALMEYYGLLPTLSQQLKDDALYIDELALQDRDDYLQTLELLDIFILVLNAVNEQVMSSSEQSSHWSERIFKYFHKACSQLSVSEQFIAYKEKFTLDSIKNSLLEFVNCQV